MTKRLHVNLAVADLAASVRFYSGLFGAAPTVLKPDYAKWMLDDPRVNFAVAARGRTPGLDHLGIQAETAAELAETYARMRDAGGPVDEQGAVACCYARSEKSWATDPSGVAWEAFLTTGESTVYGDGTGEVPAGTPRFASPPAAEAASAAAAAAACCTPATPQGVCCPPKPALAPEAACCGGPPATEAARA